MEHLFKFGDVEIGEGSDP